MGRLRGGWALTLLLGVVGCAGGGDRRPPGLLPAIETAAESAPTPTPTPQPRGGLFARRASTSRSTMIVVSPTIARYFPGLARSIPAASVPAGPIARGDSGTALSSRGAGPAEPDDSGPMLPVSLNVEVGPAVPDAATTRLVAHEQALPPAADPPPLVEAGTGSAPPPPSERTDRGFQDLPAFARGRGPSPDAQPRTRAGGDPVEVAGAAAGPPELVEARPARKLPPRSRAVRPVAYLSEAGGPPAMLPPVLFPPSYYEADPAARAPAPAPAIPPPARRAWRPWSAWPGLSRREPGDVAQGG